MWERNTYFENTWYVLKVLFRINNNFFEKSIAGKFAFDLAHPDFQTFLQVPKSVLSGALLLKLVYGIECIVLENLTENMNSYTYANLKSLANCREKISLLPREEQSSVSSS